ncbi:hypothetical protein cand_034010 [Cryptosporidium andersoni]|uniref:SHSP domain-containing protein n=1 Tax=Cryptosporidium andersoni TaxID=117008 RepID=A0A1J4MW71_9CRYT|nr:hypothetical protein cand_034010 [Cryptosporidium andersoni]
MKNTIFKILILFALLFPYIICLKDQSSLDLHNIKGNSDDSKGKLEYIDEFIIPIDTTIIEYNYNYPLINIKAKAEVNIKDYELNTDKVEITDNSLLGNLTHIEYKMKLDKNGQLIFDKIVYNENNNMHLINDSIEKIIDNRKELDKQSMLDISELYTNSTKVKDIIPENLLNEILSNCTDIEFFEVPSLMNNESFYKEKSVPFKEKKMNKCSRQGENSSIVGRHLELNVPINESENSTVDFTIENNMLIFEKSTENIENIVIEQNTDIDILENRHKT